MKAILYDMPGGAEVLYYGDAPQPTPSAGELLVRVHATALNRADLLQRSGGYPPPKGASDILGLEIAGEVVHPVGRWKIGDRVMGVISGGGYAEYATIPAGMAMPIPENLTYEQAAAIPEAFLTAYLNLFWLGKLQAGENILIHAGASGIGTAAIQLAREANAHIFVTAGSDEKLALCQTLGAQVLINYKTESFKSRIADATEKRGVDVILDFIGANYWNDNLASLAINGRLMLIGYLGGTSAQLDIGTILPKSLTISGTTLRRTPQDQKVKLTQEFSAFGLSRLAEGTLRPVIDSIYPLSHAADAHLRMQSNHNLGKIILTVN